MSVELQASEATNDFADQQRLAWFIASQGGRITFDQFMAESLYGDNGYYQRRVKISTGAERGDFVTAASLPLFAVVIHRMVDEYLRSYSQPKFWELAGGMGTFKQNFLEVAETAGLGVDYYSFDISSRLIALQQLQKGRGVQANVLELPLAKGGVKGVVFANELLDAFPFRVVSVIKKGGRFDHLDELSFEVDEEGEVQSRWLPCESEAVYQYWERQLENLARSGFDPYWDLEQEQVLCVNLHEKQLMQELDRVVDRGRVVLFDYGGTAKRLMAKPIEAYPRQYPVREDFSVEKTHRQAYRADITANVNWSNVINEAEGLGWQFGGLWRQDRLVWDNLRDEERRILETRSSNHPWQSQLEWLCRKQYWGLVLEKE